MPILLVHRTWHIRDFMLPYDVEVNKIRVGNIWMGQKKPFVIAPGNHSIRVTNGCFKSNVVFVRADQEHELVAICNPDPNQSPSQNFAIFLADQIRDDSFYEKSIRLSVQRSKIAL